MKTRSKKLLRIEIQTEEAFVILFCNQLGLQSIIFSSILSRSKKQLTKKIQYMWNRVWGTLYTMHIRRNHPERVIFDTFHSFLSLGTQQTIITLENKHLKCKLIRAQISKGKINVKLRGQSRQEQMISLLPLLPIIINICVLIIFQVAF